MRSPSSATSTASASASSRCRASPRSSAAARTCGSTGEIGLFLLTSEQGISAGTRRVEALAGEAAVARAQADQGILEELEQAAKVDRRELVDEYAKLREQLKAREREIQALRMKLATGAGAAAGEDLAEVGGTLVWTPRHEGLDRKGHAEVVDDFRNRHKGKRFVLVSTSVAEDGVSVITRRVARPRPGRSRRLRS